MNDRVITWVLRHDGYTNSFLHPDGTITGHTERAEQFSSIEAAQRRAQSLAQDYGDCALAATYIATPFAVETVATKKWTRRSVISKVTETNE